MGSAMILLDIPLLSTYKLSKITVTLTTIINILLSVMVWLQHAMQILTRDSDPQISHSCEGPGTMSKHSVIWSHIRKHPCIAKWHLIASNGCSRKQECDTAYRQSILELHLSQ